MDQPLADKQRRISLWLIILITMPLSNKFYNQSWFYWLVLAIVTAGLGWFFYTQFYVEPVDWSDGRNQETNIQVIDNKDGTKTVRNVGENVELVVSEEWEETKNPGSVLNVLYRGVEQPKFDTALIDGINFSVKKLSQGQGMNVENWLLENSQYNKFEIDKMERININNINILVIDQKFDDDNYLPNNFVNQRFDYLLISGNYLLDYSCDIIAQISEVFIYKNKCENILKNNIK